MRVSTGSVLATGSALADKPPMAQCYPAGVDDSSTGTPNPEVWVTWVIRVILDDYLGTETTRNTAKRRETKRGLFFFWGLPSGASHTRQSVMNFFSNHAHSISGGSIVAHGEIGGLRAAACQT
jgi:hypothetical protein